MTSCRIMTFDARIASLQKGILDAMLNANGT